MQYFAVSDSNTSKNFTSIDANKYAKKKIGFNLNTFTNIALVFAVISFVGSLSVLINVAQNTQNSRASGFNSQITEAINASLTPEQQSAEKMILDKEIANGTLTVPPIEEITYRIDIDREPEQQSQPITEADIEIGKYNLLREQAIQKFVNSHTVHMVGFWVPASTYEAQVPQEDKADLPEQQNQAPQALEKIQECMKSGLNYTPLDIAEKINTEFPVLSSRVAVNAIILSKTKTPNALNVPLVFEDSILQKAPEPFKTVAGLSTGTIQIVNKTTVHDAGGVVINVLKTNSGQATSYADWLKSKM